MLVIRGIVTVVIITILSAIGGGLIAAASNWLAPDYYPGVFRSMSPTGEAPDVGVGMGVVQGQIMGLLIGGLVVLALALFGQLSWAACFRGIGILFGCAALAALLGGLIGLAIGVQAPGYYRSVLRSGRHPDFNPIDVGIGLGTSQGAMIGIMGGGLIVVILAWWQSRGVKPDVPESEATAPAGGGEDFNFRLPRKNF